MNIDQFIKTVNKKLRMPTVKVYDSMRGSELKLTGFKEVKGKKIEDHKIYKYPTTAEVPTNHEWKLKLAWLRGGRSAVRTYLSKYMTATQLEQTMVFLNEDGKSNKAE